MQIQQEVANGPVCSYMHIRMDNNFNKMCA